MAQKILCSVKCLLIQIKILGYYYAGTPLIQICVQRTMTSQNSFRLASFLWGVHATKILLWATK